MMRALTRDLTDEPFRGGRVALIAAVAVLCIATPGPAGAQSPHRFDIGGGYAHVIDHEIDEALIGWFASATGHLTPLLAITGEVSDSSRRLPVLGTTQRFGSRSFVAGPRLSVRPSDRVTLYGHAVGGIVSQRMGILDQSSTVSHSAFQTGGGAEVWMSTAVGVRAGADYRRITIDGEASSQVRFFAGTVFALGR